MCLVTYLSWSKLIEGLRANLCSFNSGVDTTYANLPALSPCNVKVDFQHETIALIKVCVLVTR